MTQTDTDVPRRLIVTADGFGEVCCPQCGNDTWGKGLYMVDAAGEVLACVACGAHFHESVQHDLEVKEREKP